VSLNLSSHRSFLVIVQTLKRGLQEFDVSHHVIISKNSSSAAGEKEAGSRCQMVKGVKHSSPRPAQELCETITNKKDLGSTSAWSDVLRA